MSSERQVLWIPGRLPGLNELFRAKGVTAKRSDWNAYNQLKRDSQQRIVLLARSQLKPVKRARFEYEFHEPNKRRDPSNVASGAVKLVEDALQLAGIISNDGWKTIAGFSVSFVHDKEAQGVMVRIWEAA